MSSPPAASAAAVDLGEVHARNHVHVAAGGGVLLSRSGRDVAARRQPTLAIAHKGVIRALMALATGWTMTGEPPVKLGRPAVHLFRIEGAGNIQVERLDIALEPGG